MLGYGDFLGMGSSHIVRIMELMTELYLLDEALSWNDLVPLFVKNQWIALIEETLLSGNLFFHRSTRPGEALPSELPVVGSFGNYGKFAYGARAY